MNESLQELDQRYTNQQIIIRDITNNYKDYQSLIDSNTLKGYLSKLTNTTNDAELNRIHTYTLSVLANNTI